MIAQYPISVPILLHLLFLVWPPPLLRPYICTWCFPESMGVLE